MALADAAVMASGNVSSVPTELNSSTAPLMSIGARDIISGKFGSSVPVKRAQAGSGNRSLSSEDMSSISSFQSNNEKQQFIT